MSGRIEPNYKAYHESLNAEFDALKDRVRHLIAGNHWPSDGEYKEGVLQKILVRHLPDNLRVGRGFVCFSDKSVSTQIDVLITDKSKPTLFKEDDFVIVTPDCVKAIIEVKSNRKDAVKGLKTLSNNIGKIREAGNNGCLAGLFAYTVEKDPIYSTEKDLIYSTILTPLQEKSEGNETHSVNFVSIGQHAFFRFWKHGERSGNVDIQNAQWRGYHLKDLARAYFVSNIICETTEYPTGFDHFWFPAEGGKERTFIEGRTLSGDKV